MSNGVVYDAAGICSLVDGDPKLLEWSELVQYLWVYNDVRPALDRNVLEKPVRSICLAAVEPDKLDVESVLASALVTPVSAWTEFAKKYVAGLPIEKIVADAAAEAVSTVAKQPCGAQKMALFLLCLRACSAPRIVATEVSSLEENRAVLKTQLEKKEELEKQKEKIQKKIDELHEQLFNVGAHLKKLGEHSAILKYEIEIAESLQPLSKLQQKRADCLSKNAKTIQQQLQSNDKELFDQISEIESLASIKHLASILQTEESEVDLVMEEPAVVEIAPPVPIVPQPLHAPEPVHLVEKELDQPPPTKRAKKEKISEVQVKKKPVQEPVPAPTPTTAPPDVVTCRWFETFSHTRTTPPKVAANRAPYSKDTLETSVRLYLSTGLIVRTLNGNALTEVETQILTDYIKTKVNNESEVETFLQKTKTGPWYNVNYVTDLKRKKSEK